MVKQTVQLTLCINVTTDNTYKGLSSDFKIDNKTD